MRNKIIFPVLLLLAIAAGLIYAQLIFGGQGLRSANKDYLWKVVIQMDFSGASERAKIRLTLPKSNDHQIIYNQIFDPDDMSFYTRDRKMSGNHIGFWRSELLNSDQSISYTFSVQPKRIDYQMPEGKRLNADPEQFVGTPMEDWLDASKYIQSNDEAIRKLLKKIIGKEKDLSGAVQKIFDYVRGEIRYKSETGSKDAKETLENLVADCGGQARLFVALSRAIGIPSRTVGGIILERGEKKITHLWAENYLEGQWIPFDVVNNHYGVIPRKYLEMYRGDYALIKHLGVNEFDYMIKIKKETMPPVDNPWSLYAIPVHFQQVVQTLLLIPLGALVVALARTLIGIPTFGTFSPVLIALTFRELSLGSGLLAIFLILFLGWLLRCILDYLKILAIPRLSIVITCVVIMILMTLLIGVNMGSQKIFYVSLFPIVILTWVIERFSVLQIEDGFFEAVKSLLGTVLVASATYFLMNAPAIKNYLFSFPQLLLVILAILLILGRYQGMRLTEIWRFRHLRKELKKKG